MKLSKRTNDGETLELKLAQPANGHGVSPMPEEFAGLYQAGYEAGATSGRELGYRQGYQTGFGDGRRQGSNNAAPAAVENASEKPVSGLRAGMLGARLFGLPCVKCMRFFYSDEERCPYCWTPRAASAEPPSAARG